MKKTRIIIVEDNNIIALDLKHSLEKMDYEIVAVVTSGEEAIAQTSELKPDLVIMDIRLRGNIDGIEVARSIHTKECLPILFVSAYGDEETIQRAEKCADKIGYIVKPYNNDQLFSSIEKLLV